MPEGAQCALLESPDFKSSPQQRNDPIEGTLAMSNADIRGLFIWHELMTTDPQGAAAFYSGLFRWGTQPSSMPGYALWMSGSIGVAGLMAQPGEVQRTGTPPSWLAYLGTTDVDATAQAAERLGGTLLKVPTDIPGVGRFAVLSDPQGAAFAVFTPATPAPSNAAASEVVSRFSWHELATTDPNGALDFYSQLFGWSAGPAHDRGGSLYQVIERDGTPVGGIYRPQDPSKPPHWLTYIQVDTLDDTVAAARAAGSQIVQGAHEVPGGHRVAIIFDPQGGAIALHEPPKAAAAPARRRAARKSARPRTPAKRSAARSVPTRSAKAKAPIRKSARPQASAKRSAARPVPTRSAKGQSPARHGGAKRTSAAGRGAPKRVKAKVSAKPGAARTKVVRRAKRPTLTVRKAKRKSARRR